MAEPERAVRYDTAPEVTAAGVPDVTVVLPAHNEELLLASTVRSILGHLEETGATHEMFIVENGSADRTPEIVRELSNEHPRIEHRQLHWADYGAALATGIAAARGRYVVTFDVDLFDPSFLRAGIDLVRSGAADLVLASKRAPGSRDHRPLVRRVLTTGFAVVLRLAVRVPVSDPHGMKVMRRQAIAPVATSCKMRGSLFDVELVVRASEAGLSVLELPVTVNELRPPRTGLLKRTIESFRGTLRLRRLLRAERRNGRLAAAEVRDELS